MNVKDFLNKFQVSDNPSNEILEAKTIQIIWDNQPIIAVILHDITEQYIMLSLKVTGAQKDALLATVPHELRTTLNFI